MFSWVVYYFWFSVFCSVIFWFVSCSTLDPQIKGQLGELDKKGASKLVGKTVAERALQAGIKKVVFDRGGYVYTGRVAEVAAGAREAGLDF